MDEEIKKRLDAQDEILAKIYKSAEKTRKYFMWTLIISVAVIVLPLIGMLFVIPKFIGIYTSSFQGLF
jgi:RNA-binding protein YhbY